MDYEKDREELKRYLRQIDRQQSRESWQIIKNMFWTALFIFVLYQIARLGEFLGLMEMPK